MNLWAIKFNTDNFYPKSYSHTTYLYLWCNFVYFSLYIKLKINISSTICTYKHLFCIYKDVFCRTWCLICHVNMKCHSVCCHGSGHIPNNSFSHCLTGFDTSLQTGISKVRSCDLRENTQQHWCSSSEK